MARQTIGDHPGVIAWERVVDQTIAEISPQIRGLLYEALGAAPAVDVVPGRDE